MNDKLKKSLSEIAEMIQRGELQKAQDLLVKMTARKLPPNFRLEAASLTRRAGIPQVGLRLLRPVVRPQTRKVGDASPAEIAEYGACLTRLGAAVEAQHLLEKVKAEDAPQAALFLSFALIAQWKYAEAIPHLRSYVDREQNEYWKQVARLNLVSSLIFEQATQEAKPILDSLVRDTKESGLGLLHANSLHLSAALRVLEGKSKEALPILERAKSLLNDPLSIDAFLIRKWETIAAFTQNPRSEAALKKLGELRQESVNRRHWETTRECDRFRAIALKEHGLILYLYCGTPYESYRQRLLKDWGEPLSLPSEYHWDMGKPSSGTASYRLIQGDPTPKGDRLKPNQLLHRTLSALGQDFYRPQRIATLFYHLFPEENFFPDTSTRRVHEAIRRLRQWFEEEAVPMTVLEKDGEYILDATKPCSLVVPVGTLSVSKWQKELKVLRQHCSERYFSRAEAEKLLHTKARTTIRILEDGCKSGSLARSGSGAKVRYRFAGS